MSLGQAIALRKFMAAHRPPRTSTWREVQPVATHPRSPRMRRGIRRGVSATRLRRGDCGWPPSRPLPIFFASAVLRSLRRMNPSSVRNVLWWLCLKYSNQPRSVRFTSAMVWDMLRPEVRLGHVAPKRSLRMSHDVIPDDHPLVPEIDPTVRRPAVKRAAAPSVAVLSKGRNFQSRRDTLHRAARILDRHNLTRHASTIPHISAASKIRQRHATRAGSRCPPAR
jgi:hypothetical protein